MPRLDSEGSVNNKRELHRFKFAHVFQKSTYQDQVFNRVAKGVIDNCLRGYNGTVFAYGQTGSGKTFTVTGGPENYADRGLIPRTLNYLFQQFRSKFPIFQRKRHFRSYKVLPEVFYELF